MKQKQPKRPTIDERIAIIEEAKRQGKIRAVRDVVVIGNIRWHRSKKHAAKHEGWRNLMATVPFGDSKDWRRTAHLRVPRTHVAYLQRVAELEAQGVPQPEASWQAVDEVADKDRAERLAMAKATRLKKWGEPKDNLFLPRNKPSVFKNAKVRKEWAEKWLKLQSTYSFLRFAALSTGRTVDEVAADEEDETRRAWNLEAIAECRDRASLKEADRQRAELKKLRDEREAKAAALRVRGKGKATAARNRELRKLRREPSGEGAADSVVKIPNGPRVIVQKFG